jgi:hypothetical protein
MHNDCQTNKILPSVSIYQLSVYTEAALFYALLHESDISQQTLKPSVKRE